MTMRVALAAAIAAATLALAPAEAAAWATSCCLPWQRPAQLAITPDGRFAYASDYGVAIAFARDASSGALSVIDTYDAPGGGTTELSPDGRTLYAAATDDPIIAEFRRDEATGALTHIGDYRATPNGSRRYQDIGFTHDGRSAYVTDGNSIELVARDPDTGLLSYRSSLRPGDAAAPGLSTAVSLELSADDRFLYVAQYPTSPLLVFARGNDGALTQQQQIEAPAAILDLAISPDATRLYVGPSGPHTYARDPSTGMLTLLGSAGVISTENYSLPDAALLPTPDGKGLYATAPQDHRLYQFAATGGGLEFVKTYRENVDGQGIRDPRGLSMSPDGAFVYLGSGPVPTTSRAGRVATFRRDDSTNMLSFSAIFEGPIFTGHPPGESASVTINDGAAYTNDPDVTLTIRGIGWPNAFYAHVSNDGGFGPDASEWIALTGESNTVPWRLATSGPERLPKTVYMRTREGEVEQVVTDEIVLDQRPPEVVSAEQLAGAVRVEARDRLSGIARMQITRDRRKPGAWRAFHGRTKFHTGRRPIYVRVRDRAGNRSKWAVGKGRR